MTSAMLSTLLINQTFVKTGESNDFEHVKKNSEKLGTTEQKSSLKSSVLRITIRWCNC